MPAAISITVPTRDIQELSRIMQLRAKHLSEDVDKTVNFTGWFIARAASAATKMSPKTRPIVKNPTFGGSGVGSRSRFAAKKIRRGAKTLIPIRADSKSEARQSRKAIIGNRGFAKDAWKWVIGSLGRSPGHTLNRMDRTAFNVSRQKAGGQATLILQSRVDYATQAFKTKGPATADNIARRAANAMRKDLERRAKKTLAEGNK